MNTGQDTELNFYTQAPNQYGVYFMCEGVLLETLYVYEGMDAKPTCVPVKTGYTFTSWDKSLSNVKEAMVVTAQFEINHYKV